MIDLWSFRPLTVSSPTVSSPTVSSPKPNPNPNPNPNPKRLGDETVRGWNG